MQAAIKLMRTILLRTSQISQFTCQNKRDPHFGACSIHGLYSIFRNALALQKLVKQN